MAFLKNTLFFSLNLKLSILLIDESCFFFFYRWKITLPESQELPPVFQDPWFSAGMLKGAFEVEVKSNMRTTSPDHFQVSCQFSIHFPALNSLIIPKFNSQDFLVTISPQKILAPPTKIVTKLF